MKTRIVRKSKKRTLRFLFCSFALLGLIIYLFLTDKTQYPKGNSFYWIGIILFGLTTLYFIYDFINKTPLYIFTKDGIYTGRMKKMATWTDLTSFECKSPYQKYITPKLAVLYDKFNNEILTIDFTASDISLEKMEKLLKIKLKLR